MTPITSAVFDAHALNVLNHALRQGRRVYVDPVMNGVLYVDVRQPGHTSGYELLFLSPPITGGELRAIVFPEHDTGWCRQPTYVDFCALESLKLVLFPPLEPPPASLAPYPVFAGWMGEPPFVDIIHAPRKGYCCIGLVNPALSGKPEVQIAQLLHSSGFFQGEIHGVPT